MGQVRSASQLGSHEQSAASLESGACRSATSSADVPGAGGTAASDAVGGNNSSLTGDGPTGSSTERRPLRPLPPMPRGPPPDLNAEAPQQGKVQPEDKYRHARHVNAIVRDLRKREADAVLCAVARALLAACEDEGVLRATSSENVAPVL